LKLKNVLAIAGCIVIVYIFYIFYSGTILYKQIQGQWTSVETNETYNFIGKDYIHNTNSGEYLISGNKITFIDSNDKFPLRVSKNYIIIDGTYYLKS
jgi:hypothetical protein